MPDITIRSVDNLHGHLRDPEDPDDTLFWDLLPYSLRQFRRYVHFGNYKPNAKPIVNAHRVRHNRAVIQGAARRWGDREFEVLMTIMLTPDTTPEIIHAAADEHIYGAKSMPAHGSTNSHCGIPDFRSFRFHDNLAALAERGIPWLSHSEVPDPALPPVEREAAFIPIIAEALNRHPKLRVVFEHISTKEAVAFVQSAHGRVMATVTPHHLYETTARADADPFLQCMPYPKGMDHVLAVREAVLSGHPLFAFGDDSAPHLKAKKLVAPPAKPASGVYHSASLAVMAQFFAEHDALHLMEAFMSEHGARWRGLPLNKGTITLEERTWQVPDEYHGVVPYRYRQELHWQLKSVDPY